MNRLLIVILFSLSAFACKTESKKDTTSSETATKEVVINSDELRIRYETYYQALESPFPTKCRPELNKVNPADAAPLDSMFFIFREELKEIVAEKNIFKLLEHTDENIQVGFGDQNGLKQFIIDWKLDSEQNIPNSDLWPTLETILNLGGLFNGMGDYFGAPYLDQCYPGDKDAFETGAIIGAGVRMRAGPNLETKVLKKLSYDVVNFIEQTPIELKIGSETHPWIKIKTHDGTEGFVYGKFYRSPIDYRAGFTKNKAGNWKMVTLLAGD